MRLFVLSLLLATAASAQTGTLSGIVTDGETGEALAGAAVVVAGTSLGAATNLDARLIASSTVSPRPASCCPSMMVTAK
ncbi:MAG: hypothetical protein AAFY55_18190, partial [Bacteroidota bacterium]